MQTLLGDLRKQNHGLLADECFEEKINTLTARTILNSCALLWLNVGAFVLERRSTLIGGVIIQHTEVLRVFIYMRC